jgi:hypothetical protein
LENGEAKFKDVSDWIPDAEVEALLEAYKNGTPYDKQGVYAFRDMTEIVERARKEMSLIAQYKKEEERATEYLNKTKKMILWTMDKHGVKNVQVCGLTISKVGGYFRATIDTKALKEEQSEIAQKYSKITEVAPPTDGET